jgi:hypothetical protein
MAYATEPFELSTMTRELIGDYDDPIRRSFPINAEDWFDNFDLAIRVWSIVDCPDGWRRELIEMDIVDRHYACNSQLGKHWVLELRKKQIPANHVCRGLLVHVDTLGFFVAILPKGVCKETGEMGWATYHEDFDLSSDYTFSEL